MPTIQVKDPDTYEKVIRVLVSLGGTYHATNPDMLNISNRHAAALVESGVLHLTDLPHHCQQSVQYILDQKRSFEAINLEEQPAEVHNFFAAMPVQPILLKWNGRMVGVMYHANLLTDAAQLPAYLQRLVKTWQDLPPDTGLSTH